MKRMAILATWIVALNLAVNTVHAFSHVQSAVELAPWQMVFVALAVYLLPLASVVLYWLGRLRAGAAVLTVSMFAALVFGIYYHLIAESPDHVSHHQGDARGMIFTVTAVLLIPAAMLGAGFGGWSWRRASSAA